MNHGDSEAEWDQQFAAGREMRKRKDGQVWAAVLRVDAAVEATAAPSDGSNSPGGLYPSLFHLSTLPPP